MHWPAFIDIREIPKSSREVYAYCSRGWRFFENFFEVSIGSCTSSNVMLLSYATPAVETR